MGDYNGWRNWDTWNVHLWLTNEYSVYKEALHICTTLPMEHAIGFLKTLARDFTNAITDGVEFPKVDWEEVYEAFRAE
jgi:hypothetical protein